MRQFPVLRCNSPAFGPAIVEEGEQRPRHRLKIQLKLVIALKNDVSAKATGQWKCRMMLRCRLIEYSERAKMPSQFEKLFPPPAFIVIHVALTPENEVDWI